MHSLRTGLRHGRIGRVKRTCGVVEAWYWASYVARKSVDVGLTMPSWLMWIPRSARRSSTLRSDSGYLTYIITTRRMTAGELLKYRNGLLMA